MEKQEKALLGFCKDLIGIEGVSGSEGLVADCLEQEMLFVGFDSVVRDSYGNVIGMVKGNLPGSLMFEGHMDTVGIQDRSLWKYDPFGSDFVEGKLYGRGTSDMRCALAAMVHAIGSLAKEGKRNHATLYVVGVVQEEIFEGIGFGKVLDSITPDAVVLGEASDLRLMLGQKGRCELRIETFGKNAHSAHPERGKNAIETMTKVLQRLSCMPCPSSPLLGEALMVVTDIISRPYPGSSVIPDHCQITIDRRTLVGETKESILSEMEAELSLVFPSSAVTNQPDGSNGHRDFACTIPTASALCYTGEILGGQRFFPAWQIEEDAPLVGHGFEAMGKCGLPLERGYYPFCTDGSESSGNRNIPTIGFGPSSPSLAHIIDEYVQFDQVLVSRDVYAQLAKTFRA
ncbi:MAG TPA: YgeY family selenium metabolism-linked hydrolase [Sphaerochaeta sp.]|nr:YgeY family selenium metabolism-linked hydrolase [Sphaerochaeta sp.]